MTKRYGLVGALLCALLVTAGCETLKVVEEVSSLLLGANGEQGLTMDTIVKGLKEALVVGTQNTVASTSKKGGYADNALIRIALPRSSRSSATRCARSAWGLKSTSLSRR